MPRAREWSESAGSRSPSMAASRGRGGPSCGLPPGGLLHDLEQLDLEDQSRAGLDDGRRPPITIGDVRGTDQLALAADLHSLEPFGPALYDLIDGKLPGSSPLNRAVEDGPVDEGAVIMGLDLVRGRRRRAGARLDLHHDQT